jgi:hypothetical protein
MRFPDIPLMEATFNLFRRLNFDKKTQIPYYLSTPHDVTLFNGFLVSGPIPHEEDPFHVSESKGGLVPDKFAQKGYSHWIDEKLNPFKKALVNNFDEGWKYLMQYDSYSFRTYMTLEEPKYPNSVSLVWRSIILFIDFYRSLIGAKRWIREQASSMPHSLSPSWNLLTLIIRRKM